MVIDRILDPNDAPAPKPVRLWHPRAKPRNPSSPAQTPTHTKFQQHRRVSEKSSKSARSAESRTSGWSARSSRSAARSFTSRVSNKEKKLPPVEVSHPLSRLAEALDLANIAAPSAKERRANKAALALRQLILDPPRFELCAATIPGPHFEGASTAGDGGKGGTGKGAGKGSKVKAAKGKKSFVPQLREKDVSRLRTQLLRPVEAKMVIAQARSLPVDKRKSSVDRAVCLNCSEDEATQMIEEAQRIEVIRRKKEERLENHRFSTLKVAPPPPPRLPVLLSLFSGLTAAGAMPGTGADASIMTLGLFEPASAISLHRPLAGALPSAETLRRGFDALMNAESKVYLYEGPSHKNIHPPTDRISVYTYWWGFELALPPPSMKYLAHAKSIATSVLNLLSVIVYAVPGGTRELAPFVGVLSRFIDNEWALLKSQDKGKGVVCGATWFIPAALVARPWDFGEETIRDKIIDEDEKEHLRKEPIDPSAIVRVKGPKGEAEGVIVGVGKGLAKEKRLSPTIPWSPDSPDPGGQPPYAKPTDEIPSILPALPKPPNATCPTAGEPVIHRDVPFTTLAVQPPALISASAPASPARTTPPTPARARFGWRYKSNKLSARKERTKASHLVSETVVSSSAVDSRRSSCAQPTSSIAHEAIKEEDLASSLVDFDADCGKHGFISRTSQTISRTLGSKTMRRISVTLASMSAIASTRVDPFPASHHDGQNLASVGCKRGSLAVDVALAQRELRSSKDQSTIDSPATTVSSTSTWRGMSLRRFRSRSA